MEIASIIQDAFAANKPVVIFLNGGAAVEVEKPALQTQEVTVPVPAEPWNERRKSPYRKALEALFADPSRKTINVDKVTSRAALYQAMIKAGGGLAWAGIEEHDDGYLVRKRSGIAASVTKESVTLTHRRRSSRYAS